MHIAQYQRKPGGYIDNKFTLLTNFATYLSRAILTMIFSATIIVYITIQKIE